MYDVVIIGGGTAGTIAASIIQKFNSEKKICLIESNNIKKIGVGESTTSLTKFLINGILNISDNEFIKETDAIYKLNSRFKNFYSNESFFDYPLGMPFLNDLEPDFLKADSIVKYFNKNKENNSFVKNFFPSYYLFNNNRISKNFFNFDLKKDAGYHFDANKFSIFLKEKYIKKQNITIIEEDVVDFTIKEMSIESVLLKSGEKIHAKSFIDCSGHSSVFKKISKFIDFSSYLPNNSAWATQISYTDPYSEMQPFTTATAIDHGWCWYTPIFSRTGNGYVYSDNYVSDEQALEEFKDYLIKHSPLKINEKFLLDQKFLNFKFSPGYYLQNEINNLFFVGQSSGFLEPLESSSIHIIIESCLKICKILKRKSINKFSIDSYNLFLNNSYESWKTLISFIYMQTIRDETEYWKDIKNKTWEIDYLSKDFQKNWFSTKDYLQGFTNSNYLQEVSYNAFFVISKGCDIDLEYDFYELERDMFYNNHIDFISLSKKYENIFEKNKTIWKKESIKQKNIFDFMKEMHND